MSIQKHSRMKKIVLLIVSAFSMSGLFATDDIEIHFAATGTSTTVETVKVENITKGISLTLNGSDILVLTKSTSIGDLKSDENVQIIPNPIKNEGEIRFFAPQSGVVNIRIIDASGKIVASQTDNLQSGNYSYEISGLTSGIYIANIIGQDYSYKTTIVSNGNNSQSIALKQKSNRIESSSLKSFKSLVSMAYSAGDDLKFIGISGTLSDTVIDIPTISKTITFTFIAPGLIPTVAFSANSYSVLIGETVTFTDQSTGTPTSWNWNFGDGFTSTQQNCTHSYSTADTFDVILKAGNAKGCDSVRKQIVVKGSGTINGNITITTGNCMPPITAACQTSPYQTSIEITKPSQVYDATLLLKTISSSSNGAYQITLPEGDYSLFVIDNSSYKPVYYNNSNIITIVKNTTISIDTNIDHATW